MVTDRLMDKIGSVPILSVKWSVSIDTMINLDGDGDGDGDRDSDDTCKRTIKGRFTRKQKFACAVVLEERIVSSSAENP